MSDPHLRILRLVANNMQRELGDHDAVDHAGDTASTGRRQHLEQMATRTRARVAAAEARRRFAPGAAKVAREDKHPGTELDSPSGTDENAEVAAVHPLRAADQTVSDRDQAATDRESAAADRDEAASDRDQTQAAADQQASNRYQAAADRKAAAADRKAAAGDRVAAKHDREQAKVELRHAQIDELTGAFGRKLGTLALEREINRAGHGNGRLVLAFVDVDGLKQVNDREGHAAGDALLRDVVGAIQTHLRSYDPVVRFGGDEFVCALGDSMPDQARCRFQEIQATIEQTQPAASISVGFAALRPEDTLEQLTERGDTALYEAKHSG
jgi:diguanylate cyclase (GGDEF)-like protein